MKKNKIGLVLSGGGARGAYEAGVLHFIRTQLSPKLRSSKLDIICGCSVGAINTSFLASTMHEPLEQTKHLISLWQNLTSEQVYQRTPSSLISMLGHSVSSLMGNLTQFNFFESINRNNHFQALLDTKPLEKFLKKNVRWNKIKENVLKKKVESVALIATQHRSGRSTIFLQTGSRYFKSDRFDLCPTQLAPVHAMASAAIPLVFPSIKINEQYFVDGGVRMNTPLSPAIHLGAEKLFIIGLHAENNWPKEIDTPNMPPTLGEHLGKLFHSFLLDNLKNDIIHLQQVNRVIEASESLFGKDFCPKMNKKLEYQSHLKTIDSLLIQPSVPISQIFDDWYFDKKRKSHLNLLEKFLMRALDIQPAVSGDLLSYLAFEADYLTRLVDLGFNDAKKKQAEIEEFFSK